LQKDKKVYIRNNNFVHTDDVAKIAVQEINKKIYGYKQQDKIKNRYNETNFLTLESVILQMVECELKCRYCRGEMDVIYEDFTTPSVLCLACSLLSGSHNRDWNLCFCAGGIGRA